MAEHPKRHRPALFRRRGPVCIADPEAYLAARWPGEQFEPEETLPGVRDSLPAYRIREWNACVLHAAAAVFCRMGLFPDLSMSQLTDRLERYAQTHGYARRKNGQYDYNLWFIKRLLRGAAAENGAPGLRLRSHYLWVRRRILTRLRQGKPCLLGVVRANGGYYRSHMVTVVCARVYRNVRTGRRVTLLGVRDGYAAGAEHSRIARSPDELRWLDLASAPLHNLITADEK